MRDEGLRGDHPRDARGNGRGRSPLEDKPSHQARWRSLKVNVPFYFAATAVFADSGAARALTLGRAPKTTIVLPRAVSRPCSSSTFSTRPAISREQPTS